MFPNSRNISIALVIESIFFRNKDVSSANWLILCSVLRIVMPSMFLSSFTLAKIKKYEIQMKGQYN